MNDEDFRALVESDVKDEVADPQALMFLHDRENVSHWRNELVTLLDEVNEQLTAYKAEFNAKKAEFILSEKHGKLDEVRREQYFTYVGEYNAWRRRAAYWKRCVEKKLREVNKRRHDLVHRDMEEETPIKWTLVEWASRLIPDEGPGAEWHAEYREAKRRREARPSV